MSQGSRSSRFYYLAGAWAGITAGTLVVRAAKRAANRKREKDVLAAGGLVPEASNVVAALARRAADRASASRTALVAADGKTEWSWSAYYDSVRAFGAALTSVGGSSGGGGGAAGIAVHAFNCPEWFFAALGAMHAGWTVSGIYTTNTYDQAAHILRTSAVKVLVLESEEQLSQTYGKLLEEFPAVVAVLLRGGDSDPTSRTPSYAAFLERGENVASALPSADDLSPQRVTSLVYTSGTTGNPKAVELTHANVHSVCAMMHARIPLGPEDIVVSYLPLSHIAAQGIDIMSAIYENALKGSLKQTLLRVRPTLFFGVPRVWQKMQDAMLKAAAEKYSKPIVGPILKTIGSGAKSIASAWYDPSTPELVRCGVLAPFFAASKALVFKKVRAACGLDRCKLLYTGAAPLASATHAYLRSVDMPLLEVFGMSESCGAIAVSGPNDLARPIGSCGAALPGGILEIGPDGEVCWRGTNNFKGYKGLPKASNSALDHDQMDASLWKNENVYSDWSTTQPPLLHTGDLGEVDPKTGYVNITGRKKDLIITAGGENLAPTPIEEAFLEILAGAAAHAILVGEGRKFLVVLLAPPEDATASTPRLNESSIRAALKTYNSSYAKSRAQCVQMAAALPPLSIASGDLTPTMKVKRTFIMSRNQHLIDSFYSGEVAMRAAALSGYTSIVF